MKRVYSWVAVAGIAVAAACAGGHINPPMNASLTPDSAREQLTVAASCTQTPRPLEYVGYGQINGCDDVISSPSPNYREGSPSNATIDGVPCLSSMVDNKYHVHAFLGLLVNGKQIAINDAIGMYNNKGDFTYTPPPGQTWKPIPNWTQYAQCYYKLHSHDASGVMHIEDSAYSPPPATAFQSHYTLGVYFDIWKQPLSTTQVSVFTAPSGTTVHAYYAQPTVTHGCATVPASTCTGATAYKTWSGNPRSIPLESHTTIWLEIGPAFVQPASLPKINFAEEY
jgi:hypothetical protein